MEIFQKKESLDGITSKFLQKTHDGFLIETSYINRPEKHIICMSTQIGCAVGCKFCSSGIEGRYKRNLTTDEIFIQCENVVKNFTANGATQKPILFSFMGEGEPLLNFANVILAIDALNVFANRSEVKFSISTTAPKPWLLRELYYTHLQYPLKLQISLHGSNDRIRKALMPNCRPLSEIVSKAKMFYKGDDIVRSLEWNYVLMEGVNDQVQNAYELASLLPKNAYLKLNSYNDFDGSVFKSSDNQKAFEMALVEKGVHFEFYKTDGQDIGAACGQLSFKQA